MQNARLPKLIFGVVAAIGAGYFALLYPQLPEVMASHFNASGVATAWMSKSTFFLIFPLVMLGASVPVFVLPRTLARRSNDKINLPNKEYWLAPERREESLRFLGIQMGWFGCALLILLFCVLYNAVEANLEPSHRFNSEAFLIELGLFFTFIAVWMIRMLRRFGRITS